MTLDAYLAEVAKRSEAATPEPWCWEMVSEKGNEWVVGRALDDRTEQPIRGMLNDSHGAAIIDEKVAEGEGFSNACFIAHARADVPTLLTLLRRAVEELENAYHSPTCLNCEHIAETLADLDRIVEEKR